LKLNLIIFKIFIGNKNLNKFKDEHQELKKSFDLFRGEVEERIEKEKEIFSNRIEVFEDEV